MAARPGIAHALFSAPVVALAFALASASGAAGCLRAPEAETSQGGEPVRGDVAFYLVADDGAAEARTVPVLRPYPGQPPRVALKPTPVVARGQVARVALNQDEYAGAVLDLQLSPHGARRLAEVTRDNVGKRMAVVVGGAAVSVATIQGEIHDGRLRLAGLAQADTQALQRELTLAK